MLLGFELQVAAKAACRELQSSTLLILSLSPSPRGAGDVRDRLVLCCCVPWGSGWGG